MKNIILLFVLLLFGVFVSCNNNKIKHVIILQMENRSFDNLLGWQFDLNENFCNYINVTNPNQGTVCVNKHGYDTGPDDPGHGFDDTAEEIYGYIKDVNKPGKPIMNGFAQNALEKGHSVENPFSMFTSDQDSAPIINTLAEEYAVFTRWFSSVPGPTDPNRGFAMSCTSHGRVTNFNGSLWEQQSIFDYCTKNNITWNAYYQDDPWAIMYFKDMHTSEASKNIFELDEFYNHLSQDNFPQFTWLQPRMTSHKGPPTWQHPDASVTEGERLIKSIYEGIVNSKIWNNTLFLITYDEHGGFFDSIPPPQVGIPAPDSFLGTNGFKFDRLGIRIPTVAISPLIKKNTIVEYPPPPQKPQKSSQYDATSSIATFRKLFGLTQSLTNRDKWSGTFEHIFTEDTPRNDCLKTLPPLKPMNMEALERQWQLPLNDHMKIQIKFYCHYNHHPIKDCESAYKLVNQYEASVWLGEQAKQFMNSIK